MILFSRIGWRPVFQASWPQPAATAHCRLEADGLRLSLPLTKPPPPRLAPRSPSALLGCGGSGGCQFVRLADGRSFLLAQQRNSPGVNFGRSWTEYEEGFGDRNNFWIGLRSMSVLTQPSGSLLRIEARLWNGTLLHAEYSGLRLLGSVYNLTYDRYLRRQSNIGPEDLLARSRDKPFVTRDRPSGSMLVNQYGPATAGYGYGYGTHYGHRLGGQQLRLVGFAGWWWYREAAQGSVDFNPNGVFHYSDALPSGGSQQEVRSFIGLNQTLLPGCTGAGAREWKLLKEVRLLIEV